MLIRYAFLPVSVFLHLDRSRVWFVTGTLWKAIKLTGFLNRVLPGEKLEEQLVSLVNRRASPIRILTTLM
jgi:hypothetical protein